MNDKKKWNRRLAPHIYDYNYKVGESYYTPQTSYIENRDIIPRRKAPPPEAKTFAERYVDQPIYGSTRGLPYHESQSSLGKPLVGRRAVSVGRARSREREVDDAPSESSRLGGRSRERKVSFNMNDFSSLLDNELNFQEPARRYRKSTEKIASEEDFDINPKTRRELEDEFKRIKNELKKADSVERTMPRSLTPRTTQYDETVYDTDLGVPGRRRVKREEVSYALPPSGTKVHKSSYSESTKFDSTKPPRAPRVSRLSSLENDIDFKLPSRLGRFSSEIDDEEFKLKYHTPKPNSRNRTAEEEVKFQQNLSLRERRRKDDSEELSSHIASLVNRIKNHDSDGGGYKFSRTIRSTSLDPYDYEPRARARVQARAHQFSYGVSK